MTLVSSLFVFLSFLCFAWKRSLRYLHMLQQDDYNDKRFVSWLIANKVFDKRVSLALLLAGVVLWLAAGRQFLVANTGIVAGIAFLVFCFVEPDPRRDAKKPLVLTKRARRIIGVSLLLCAVVAYEGAGISCIILWIIVVQIIPALLVLANIALSPVEAAIQRHFMNDASARLKRISPAVIGITGSFGKTSVKHILGHVLELNAPTLFTPGSVNTLMGISRIIREQMKDDCRYFLVEMGAYGEGSIQRLCGLTPPQVGIITAIGESHYERFKTLDTVARAKFELAKAVLSNSSGKVVVHENVLSQDYARNFISENRDRFIICGRGPDVDLRIEGVELAANGLTLYINWMGQQFVIPAHLFGEHHADNMAVAFAAAVALGVSPDRVALAMGSVSQIKHRLEVKPQPDGTIYIDDAFNSNPKGFLSALQLMSMLAREKSARAILITPGVTELGEKHDAVHRMLGEAAAIHADVVLAVNPDRTPTFIEGFLSQGRHKEIKLVPGLPEAQLWLRENALHGDIILFENDLPDVFERKLKL